MRRSIHLAAALLAGILMHGPGCAKARAQGLAASDTAPDYSHAAKVFPHVWEPYRLLDVPLPRFTNADSARLDVQDGKLRLSMAQLVAAVIANNLTVATARYYPSMAQTDLLRARSGASPRGVDAAVIPSVVFAGAVGGSILGSAGGGGGGASNAGGITGGASAVSVRPSGVFDPTISLGFSVDHTSSPLNTEIVSGVPSVATGSRALSVGYVQAFPSGTSITASYSFLRQGSTQLHLLFDPDFTPGFTAAVAQQMLNGFGFKVNRALIKVAENEQGIERESFRQSTVTALVSAENAYWDLIATEESVRAAEQALAAVERLASNNRAAFEVGVMSRLDVVTAESQAAGSRRDLIVAQTNVQTAELNLKNMLSKNLDEPLASAAIEGTDTFPEPEDAQLPTLEHAMAIAKENRPEISIAQGNMKSQLDVQPFVRNSLLPNVNIFALLNTVGLYNVFGTSFVELVQFKYPQVAFGVSVTFPLRNRQAQADEVRSRLEYRQSEDTLVRTKSQVEIDVQNAIIAATQSRAQAAAAREATLLAVEKLDAEQKKLAVGISTVYNVILAQRDVFTARLAEVQARDAFAKARVTLDQAMGTTLDNLHVTVEEALNGLVKSAVQ
jgi:outer membrane protein TolC